MDPCGRGRGGERVGEGACQCEREVYRAREHGYRAGDSEASTDAGDRAGWCGGDSERGGRQERVKEPGRQ